MSVLKFGIIGNGSIAKKHINLIKEKFPNSEINVLINKKKIQSKFKLNFFIKDQLFFKSNYNYLLICNPATRHIEYLKKCIKYKQKNIFVEKPLSNNFDKLNKFIIQYPNIGKKILVGYVLLFNKLFLKTLELINKKKIGNMLSATIVCNSDFRKWRKGTEYRKTVSANRNLGGGVLNELSHELSYAIKLFGSIKKVFAKLSYKYEKKIDVETEARIICCTKKISNLGIFINFLSNKEERYCQIIGTKAHLLLDFKNMSIFLDNKKFFSISKKNANQMYKDQLNFLIKNKKNIILDKFNNAFDVTKLIKAINIASKKNKIVRLT